MARARGIALTLALALAGCGGASTRPHPATSTPPGAATSAAAASWRSAVIASGARLAIPPGWRLAHGDRGTATAILYGHSGTIAGYLNITPRQGSERLQNWARFRIGHNAREGDRAVRTLGQSPLRFASSRSSCVRDSYATKTGAHYVELACLVVGPHASTVIVGAAPPRDLRRVAPDIAQAFRRFRS